MAGSDGFEGKGTIWIHESPVDAPERDEAPEPPRAPSAPASPPAQEPIGAPAPPLAPAMAPLPDEAPRTGLGSTSCLVGLFLLGGVGLGLVVSLGLAAVLVAWWMQASM